MTCDEAKLNINAMIDNEIPEEAVQPTLSHLESCYHCRQDYIELIQLQKQMKGLKIPQPPKEWFESFHKNIFRKATGWIGRIFFIGSYILLLSYAFFKFFTSDDPSVFLKLIIGGIFLGFLILLGVSFADRFQESKNDKYKGVMK